MATKPSAGEGMKRYRYSSTPLAHAAAGLLALALVLSSPSARADHTELSRQTEWSAYSLQRNEFKLGLFKLEYGIFSRWMVGTYVLPWLSIPITQSPSINANTKVKWLDTGQVASSLKVGVFWFDVEDYSGGNVEDGDFGATVLPMTVAFSGLPHEDWTLTGEATWVQTVLNGDVSSTGETAVLGVGAQNNLQFALTAEWRVSSHVAINLVGRVAAYVTPARIDTTIHVDASTDADVSAEVSASDAQGGWMIQPGFSGSWGIWNVRAGLGYGNIFIPGMLIVSAEKFIVPDLDFYVRF